MHPAEESHKDGSADDASSEFLWLLLLGALLVPGLAIARNTRRKAKGTAVLETTALPTSSRSKSADSAGDAGRGEFEAATLSLSLQPHGGAASAGTQPVQVRRISDSDHQMEPAVLITSAVRPGLSGGRDYHVPELSGGKAMLVRSHSYENALNIVPSEEATPVMMTRAPSVAPEAAPEFAYKFSIRGHSPSMRIKSVRKQNPLYGAQQRNRKVQLMETTGAFQEEPAIEMAEVVVNPARPPEMAPLSGQPWDAPGRHFAKPHANNLRPEVPQEQTGVPWNAPKPHTAARHGQNSEVLYAATSLGAMVKAQLASAGNNAAAGLDGDDADAAMVDVFSNFKMQQSTGPLCPVAGHEAFADVLTAEKGCQPGRPGSQTIREAPVLFETLEGATRLTTGQLDHDLISNEAFTAGLGRQPSPAHDTEFVRIQPKIPHRPVLVGDEAGETVWAAAQVIVQDLFEASRVPQHNANGSEYCPVGAPDLSDAAGDFSSVPGGVSGATVSVAGMALNDAYTDAGCLAPDGAVRSTQADAEAAYMSEEDLFAGGEYLSTLGLHELAAEEGEYLVSNGASEHDDALEDMDEYLKVAGRGHGDGGGTLVAVEQRQTSGIRESECQVSAAAREHNDALGEYLAVPPQTPAAQSQSSVRNVQTARGLSFDFEVDEADVDGDEDELHSQFFGQRFRQNDDDSSNLTLPAQFFGQRGNELSEFAVGISLDHTSGGGLSDVEAAPALYVAARATNSTPLSDDDRTREITDTGAIFSATRGENST